MKKVKHNRRPCELHASVRHIMRLCRWFGVFPVEGLNNLHTWRVKFNLHSIYALYYLETLFLFCMNFGACIRRLCFKDNGITLEEITHLAFLTTVVTAVALLYKLAKRWPTLMKAAADIELCLTDVDTSNYIHVVTGISTYTIILLALVEHFLYVSFNFELVVTCLGYAENSPEAIETYLKMFYTYFFDYIPYRPWLGFLAEFVSIQGTFVWNFSDVMGMCFSIYFATYFNKLAVLFNSNKPKDWKRLRACFSNVVVLLNLINDQLAPFILVSLLTNLFFIVVQLFRSLHFTFSKAVLGQTLCYNINNHFNGVVIPPLYLAYNLFSFTFLVTKALMFAYLAANVHTSANNIALSLYEVPASEYNIEVECLQMQLRYTTVGLNGVFFFVKRKSILRVIGLIITYELVLLQFSYPTDLAEIGYNTTRVLLDEIPTNISEFINIF